MLELAILGLLLESPMHGYELRKRLTGLLGAFRAFSYGSLYPALRRMQADGLIVEDAAPDGTPKMRRARRVYQLSDAGKARFAELVGVSVRTLQEWEQGRRAPSGAARTLLMIAARNPRALLEVA